VKRRSARIILLLAAVGLGVLIFVPFLASAGGYGTTNEARAWGLANGSRAERDRPVSLWSGSLARCAHTHAREMMEQQRAFHGTPCDGYQVYQLVGMGPSPFAVHEAFLASPKHRPIIFDTRLRGLGTGVASDEDTYYVVYNFARHR
jgi:uncharacterized protein YkwD